MPPLLLGPSVFVSHDIRLFLFSLSRTRKHSFGDKKEADGHFYWRTIAVIIKTNCFFSERAASYGATCDTAVCYGWWWRSHFYVFLPLTLFVLRRTQLLSPPNHVMSAACVFILPALRGRALRILTHTYTKSFPIKSDGHDLPCQTLEIDYARSAGTFEKLARVSM
jgi:hypothetical protein